MTIVEFALVLLPLLVMIMGGLELGYQAYARAVFQGAIAEAGRKASVENPGLSGAGSIGERVKELVEDQVHTMAPRAVVAIQPRSFREFSRINQPEPLVEDWNGNGRYDAGDGDCWMDENDNGRYDIDRTAGDDRRGGAEDVVFYDATLTMPRLMGISTLIGVSDTIRMNASTAVRNQPFADREPVERLCGPGSFPAGHG